MMISTRMHLELVLNTFRTGAPLGKANSLEALGEGDER